MLAFGASIQRRQACGRDSNPAASCTGVRPYIKSGRRNEIMKGALSQHAPDTAGLTRTALYAVGRTI